MTGRADGEGTAGFADIAFRIARPRPFLMAHVGIDSVLLPLFGRADQPARRQVDTHHLIDLWRLRVAELVAHGWDPAPTADSKKTARRIAQLRNCSPPFVPVHPTSSCGLSSLCPFCWAREAMQIWNRADTLLFPPDPESRRRPPRPTSGLVETSRTHRLPASDPEILATFLADRVRRPPPGVPYGPFYRPHEIQTYPMLGAYETIAISTTGPQRQRGPWKVAIRQLLAVRPEHVGLLQAPRYRNICIRVTRHSQPDRRTLARAVSRLCQYPPWLLRGDPGQTLDALTARSGLRLGAAFGRFRSARTSTAPGPNEDTEPDR